MWPGLNWISARTVNIVHCPSSSSRSTFLKGPQASIGNRCSQTLELFPRVYSESYLPYLCELPGPLEKHHPHFSIHLSSALWFCNSPLYDVIFWLITVLFTAPFFWSFPAQLLCYVIRVSHRWWLRTSRLAPESVRCLLNPGIFVCSALPSPFSAIFQALIHHSEIIILL